jgi:hypothetical protein
MVHLTAQSAYCIAYQLETCTGAGITRGFPAGVGEKNELVPREGRERELLFPGTRGSGYYFEGFTAEY